MGVLAVCPAAVETPILDKGAVGGFVGRDYFLQGQGVKTAYDADRLAADTLRAIARNKAIVVKPRRAHASWLIARLAPGLMQRLSMRFVASQRAGQAAHRSALGTTVTPGVTLNADRRAGVTIGSAQRREGSEMKDEFSLTQKRALAVFTVLALLLGAYFLRGFFVLIVMAAVGAYLFTPSTNGFNADSAPACRPR